MHTFAHREPDWGLRVSRDSYYEAALEPRPLNIIMENKKWAYVISLPLYIASKNS
jgi:hypothetical protein